MKFIFLLPTIFFISCKTTDNIVRLERDTIPIPAIVSESKPSFQDSDVVVFPIYSSNEEKFLDKFSPDKKKRKEIGRVVVDKKQGTADVVVKPPDVIYQHTESTQVRKSEIQGTPFLSKLGLILIGIFVAILLWFLIKKVY